MARTNKKADEIMSKGSGLAWAFREWLLGDRPPNPRERGLLKEYGQDVAGALGLEYRERAYRRGYREGFRDAVKLLTEHLEVPQQLLDRLEEWWTLELGWWELAAYRDAGGGPPEFSHPPPAAAVEPDSGAVPFADN
jgi:hypothetical protein